MYEVFIQQRMEIASNGVYPKDDPFESQIALIRKHKLSVKGLTHHSWSRKYSIRQSGRVSNSAKLRQTRSLVGVASSEVTIYTKIISPFFV